MLRLHLLSRLVGPIALALGAALCCPASAQPRERAFLGELDTFSGVVFHDAEAPLRFAERPIAFADEGYQAVSFGFATGFASDSTDYQGYATWHYFPADDFEISFQAGGWFFDQDEEGQDGFTADQTFGGNISFAIRLYFIDDEIPTEEQWAWYLEAGIGLLASGDDVPGGGTTLNFLPRAGGGVVIPVNDNGVKLDAGIRWHHISNASQFGTDDNPDRDGVMIYAGLMFPLR